MSTVDKEKSREDVGKNSDKEIEPSSTLPETASQPKISKLTRAVGKTFKERTEAAVRELEELAKQKAKRSIQGQLLVQVAWSAWLVCASLTAVVFKFILFKEFWVWLVVGGLYGILVTGLYHLNSRWKKERAQRLAMIPGAKGIQALIHHIPSWISFSDTEKVEWLNTVLAKVWPYADAAICEEVIKQVEPFMEDYRPAFIKRIYFKKLTFGDAPFRVEGIRVKDDVRGPEPAVKIDIDFRWAGDANIFLAIELPAGGTATRMVPKVSNLAVSGTLRVILSPLVPEIPGFGAATVSLMKPPVVKFHLDFGAALGGSYAAGAVRAWLDPFLRNTVASMMVWPRRLVIPLLPEELTGPLDHLYLRHKGALQIDVHSASNLPRMDTFGTADPYIEMYTVPEAIEKTSVKKNTQNPVWNEQLWLLVQEPDTQLVYMTAYDVDFVNVKDLFQFNIFKGASNVFQAKDVIGRSTLRVSQFADKPGKAIATKLPLGPGEFGDFDGCGSGAGEVSLTVTYWPLDLIRGHAKAPLGAVVVTVLNCRDLAPLDRVGLTNRNPYVKLTCRGESKRTEVVPKTLEPSWTDAKFDWFKVPNGEALTVEVLDYDRMFSHRLLGSLYINLYSEVASVPGGDVTKTYALKNVPKTGVIVSKTEISPSTITLRIQWIPFQWT